MLEDNIHTGIYRRLITSSELRDLLQQTGNQPKIFYRLAPRDTAPPYLCYAARIQDEDSEYYFMKEGFLTIDIWTHQTDSSLSYSIARVLRKLLNRQYISIPQAQSFRIYHDRTIEASVENNRSNRRSEDEQYHRREMNFIVRGVDEEEVSEYLTRTS